VTVAVGQSFLSPLVLEDIEQQTKRQKEHDRSCETGEDNVAYHIVRYHAIEDGSVKANKIRILRGCPGEGDRGRVHRRHYALAKGIDLISRTRWNWLG
jgi:hypothetical protein